MAIAFIPAPALFDQAYALPALSYAAEPIELSEPEDPAIHKILVGQVRGNANGVPTFAVVIGIANLHCYFPRAIHENICGKNG